MDAAVRRRLEELLGAQGVAAGDVITPGDVRALAEALHILAASATRFRVVSDDGARRDGVVTISTRRLAAIDVRPSALVVRAGSGASIDDLTRALGEADLRITGMPERPAASHVGSLVALGAVPRRSLCGVEALLPSGETLRFGGGVLKDVVGYDVPALLLGSMGRLAVITAVSFRLEPSAARTPAAPPPGPAATASLFTAAFDPRGLLQPVP